MNTYQSFEAKDISGPTLIDAIYSNWDRLIPAINGNAAGHKLLTVILQPVNNNTTRGGKKFASLLIEAIGQDLAHKKDPTIYRTRIDFIVEDAGITQPYNFDIKGTYQ